MARPDGQEFCAWCYFPEGFAVCDMVTTAWFSGNAGLPLPGEHRTIATQSKPGRTLFMPCPAQPANNNRPHNAAPVLRHSLTPCLLPRPPGSPLLWLLIGLSFSFNLIAQEEDSSQIAITTPQADYLQQAEELLQSAQVQQAMQHIFDQHDRSLQDMIELTEIPAPPFQEEERALRFAQMLREAGLQDVVIDEVGNVIGRRPGNSSGRRVAYTAHLDTVFPAGTDVTVRQEGDTYYAPGIGDNTRGLVVLLGVLRAMQFAGIETRDELLFIGNVGEEGLGDLRGVKHLFRPGAEPIDALVAVDGGDMQRLVFGGVGSHRYRITFAGPGGHSWGAFGSANPHHALGSAIALFTRAADPITREGDKSSYNIGRIGGGTSINSIPFESWAEVDIRSGDPEKIAAIDAALQQAVKQALAEENNNRRKGEELTVDIELAGDRPAAKGNVDLPLVQRALAALAALEIAPQLSISSTDANLPLSLGVPAVTMSRGGISGDAHSPGEWWQDKDAHLGIQAGLLTVLAEAGWIQP
ncbi:MAG TPA: M20/M25/M40 family metallo-hydrolase [Xanthomonadales bacterium]|nr:M20/M25/M40 family metallo-hydrolase [Xanthomonadales bacterium]